MNLQQQIEDNYLPEERKAIPQTASQSFCLKCGFRNDKIDMCQCLFNEALSLTKQSLPKIIELVRKDTIARYEEEMNLIKNIHKLELDAISCKSLEEFMEWSEFRKLLTKDN